MKYLFFLLFLFGSTVYSQVAEEPVYQSSEVDVKPDFPGGMGNFYKLMAKNFKVPEEEGLEGKIIVEFIVEKDGAITNLNIIQDIGFGTDQETLRFMSKCPKWIPGKKYGEAVRTLYRLPINIRSNEKP